MSETPEREADTGASADAQNQERTWQAWMSRLESSAPSPEFERQLAASIASELEQSTEAANAQTGSLSDAHAEADKKTSSLGSRADRLRNWLEDVSQSSWGRLAMCSAALLTGSMPFLYAMMTFEFF